ncbi:S41 family peptidase [Anaerotalea alkaliphila]|uniref:PDZ domain-containing protein n=1 Tax=Anaerotalea alkaliphila TaxID=2662126 RepID=A0A7X5HVF2_9FIRM|nr:S41 family peptidase [Anaerotalea alkaliphila]NDL67377.1 PDZ domain-containing protein [Anaerotalea alkaliphila]
MERSLRKVLTALLVTALLLPHPAAAQSRLEAEDYAATFQYVMEFVEQNSLTPDLDQQKLFEAAMEGMFQILDPYSEFFTREEAEQFDNIVSRKYVGIGVEMRETPLGIAVTKVFRGSPAEDQGVMAGDMVLSVDGKQVADLGVGDVAALVLGEEGTRVGIVFQRGLELLEKSFSRRLVSIPTVEEIPLAGMDPVRAQKTMRIVLSGFAEDTEEEFKTLLETAGTRGVTHLVLDLRDNSGGYVDAAVAIGQMLVPAGPLVYFENKEGRRKVYGSTLERAPFRMTVLVNGHSASATEFLAAAIQDAGAGVLVGETTYGKGVAQYLFGIEEEYKLKLTMEEFFSRNGNKINGVGVVPDHVVEVPDLLSSDRRLYPGDVRPEVLELKKVLAYLGYFQGARDNSYDTLAVEGVMAFQRDAGLHVYGTCDFTTQKRLNQALADRLSKEDKPLEKALEVLWNRP